MKIIRRQTELRAARVQLRNDGENGPDAIEGYAAVFYRADDPGTEYRIWDDFYERIMPGAFDRAISEGHDARGLYDHNSEKVLGRVSSKTCILTVDTIGLRFSIPYDPTDPDHCQVVPKIRRGDVTGCSFAMSHVAATWEDIRDPDDDERLISIRNITDLNLHDVGPVTYPAYEATEVGLRTAVGSHGELVEARSLLTAHRDALDAKRNSEAEEIELRYRMIQLGNESE